MLWKSYADSREGGVKGRVKKFQRCVRQKKREFPHKITFEIKKGYISRNSMAAKTEIQDILRHGGFDFFYKAY